MQACIIMRRQDRFGEIASASIHLRGHVAKFQRQITTEYGTTFIANGGRIYSLNIISTNWDIIPNEFRGRDQSLTPECIYLLPLLAKKEIGQISGMVGLILQRIPGVWGRFRRIGQFTASKETEGWDEFFIEGFASAMLERDEYLEWDRNTNCSVVELV